jgi:quinol monooxygenase YgiN
VIDVIASIRLKPGRRNEFLAILSANVPDVLAEDGCVDYYPAVDVDSGVAVQEKDADGVTVVEKWRDVPALQAHLKAPHMLAYRAKVADMVEKVSLKVVQRV